ncbi:hypothetical protein JCM12681A_47540 [Streptomyces mexicanus]
MTRVAARVVPARTGWPPGDARDGVIAFWGAVLLRLLCKLRARVSGLLGHELLRAAKSAGPPDGSGDTREVSHKETEP